jgi:hypothetical protein
VNISFGTEIAPLLNDAPLIQAPPDALPEIGRMPRWLWLRPDLRRFDYESAEALILAGDCLAPWLEAGDVVWFDPTQTARDRDLVAADFQYRCRVDGRWKVLRRKAVKQLRVLEDGSRYLVCNQGFMRVGRVELAPVTAWARRRWWARPAVRRIALDLPVRVGRVRSRGTA